MSSFVEWTLGRRHWLALLAIMSAQIFPLFACALLITDGARHGPRRALPLATAVAVAIVLLSLGSGFLATLAMIGGVAVGAAGFVAGMLLYRTRSLELVFQVLMLGALAIVAAVTLLGPEPAAMIAPMLAELTELMESLGATAAQLDIIRGWDPVLLLGSIFAGALAQILAALMLGYWWLGLVDDEVMFGRQFRALRLGRIVGILSMVILTVSLVLTWPVVRNLTPLVVVGFLFQGLAVMHAWLHARNWGPMAAGLVYVSVVTPLSGVTVTALCATGLLDNFFSLRRPLQADA